MAEQAAVAESSTAVLEAPTTVTLPASGSAEYAEWRATGNLPKAKTQPKPADSAPADQAKEPDSEHAAAPEAASKQEQPKRQRRPDAEARIKELTAEIKSLRTRLDAGSQKTTQAESSPAKAEQQFTRPKPTPESKGQDGKPKYATYEDYVEDLSDWKAEQRIVQRERETALNQQRQQMSTKLREARERYEDFDAVAAPVLAELGKSGISSDVIAVLDQSPVLADLLYTIGGTEASKADFLAACRDNPGKALRVALLMEQEIVKELGAGKSSADRNEKGQFTAQPEKTEAPATKKTESVPPPIEIGQRGGGTMDEVQRALSRIEKGDDAAVRDWLKAENAKELRRRRGV